MVDSTRDGKFDTLKFVLIVFVILGHVLESNLSDDSCKFVYRLIYTFHMPIFIFISGYFYKDCPKVGFWKSIINLLLVYIIFQLLYFGDPKAYWNHPDIALTLKGLEYNLQHIYVPSGPLWFILSLICWKVMVKCLGSKMREQYGGIILIGSFLLGCAAGYVPIGKEFSFQRTLSFFPYYWGGYYLRYSNSELIRRFIDIVKNCSWIWLVISFLVLVFIALLGKYVPTRLLYGSDSYYMIFPTNSVLLAIERLMIYILILSVTLLIIAKARPISCFSSVGKWTLFYFLYHTYFIWLLQYSVVSLHLPMNLGLAIVYTTIILLILYVLHMFSFLVLLTNPIKR